MVSKRRYSGGKLPLSSEVDLVRCEARRPYPDGSCVVLESRLFVGVRWRLSSGLLGGDGGSGGLWTAPLSLEDPW